jgi:hypothetical protein
MKDLIIEEIRKLRDDIADEVGYDVRALGRKLQKAQKARYSHAYGGLPLAPIGPSFDIF